MDPSAIVYIVCVECLGIFSVVWSVIALQRIRQIQQQGLPAQAQIIQRRTCI